MTPGWAPGAPAAACAWAVGHSLASATGALLLARPLSHLLVRHRHRRMGWLVWALLLAPFLAPALLVGYAYSGVVLAWVREPWFTHALYVAVNLARLTPVAVLVLYLSPPPPLSREAIFCAHLVARRRRWRGPLASWQLLARGPARNAAVAFGLVFLLAFGEFEIAALMGMPSWTVWLLDAQAAGLALGASLRAAMLPLACELMVLGTLLLTVWNSRGLPRPAEEAPVPCGRIGRATAWLYLGVAAVLTGIVPVILVLPQALRGATAMVTNATFRRDIRGSLMLAILAAGAALLVAAILARVAARARAGRVVMAIALLVRLPGLLGSLLLGLLVLTAFQAPLVPGAAGWYDTLAPLLIALVLWLLPLALLLAVLIGSQQAREPAFLAARLKTAATPELRRSGQRLLWNLRGRLWFWASGLLGFQAYLELSASSVLAPSGLTPATVRLYNLMHYGQSALLSAMLLAAVLAYPLALMAVRGIVGLYQGLRSYV